MKCLSLFFVLCASILYCQDPSSYNAVYTKTFLETSQTDFNKAVRVADSLYQISETPVVKAKSLMLSATLYDQKGEFEKSLEYALKAEEIINNEDNPNWKARIYGFLASHYRFVWIFEKSKKYTDLGLAEAKKITNPDLSNNVLGLLMQEMAYYQIENKNYKSSIKKIEQAQLYFSNSKITQAFQTVTNEQILGDNYNNLGHLDQSFKHYKTALDMSKDFPENYLVGLIHRGLASVYIKKNNLKKAKEHLDIAQKISDQTKYLSLKKEVAITAQEYCLATKNLEGYVKAKEAQDTVKKKLDANAQSFVTRSYAKFERENVEIKKADSSKSIIIWIAAVLFVIGIGVFLRYRNRKRADIEHFKKIIKEFDEIKSVHFHDVGRERVPEEEPLMDNESIFDDESASQRIMSSDTEQKILEFLQKFEDDKLFTDNTISLSSLATFCETNSKYLSNIINTHKGNDFNNYINLLRVNYVISNLRKNAVYRKYKLATLAEDAGFSSSNKFSLVFKKVTSLSPSTFIKYLNDEDASGHELHDLLKI